MHILTLQVRISMDPNWPPSSGKIESLEELEAREGWQHRKLRSRRGYCSLAVVRPSLCPPLARSLLLPKSVDFLLQILDT